MIDLEGQIVTVMIIDPSNGTTLLLAAQHGDRKLATVVTAIDGWIKDFKSGKAWSCSVCQENITSVPDKFIAVSCEPDADGEFHTSAGAVCTKCEHLSDDDITKKAVGFFYEKVEFIDEVGRGPKTLDDEPPTPTKH